MQVKRFYARIEKLLPSLIVIFFCNNAIVRYVEASINERAMICRFDVFYDCSSRSTKAYQENFTSHLLKPYSVICDEFIYGSGYPQSVLAILGTFLLKPYANCMIFVKRETGPFTFGLMRINIAISIYSPQNVFQKHGPRPAAREGPPAIC